MQRAANKAKSEEHMEALAAEVGRVLQRADGAELPRGRGVGPMEGRALSAVTAERMTGMLRDVIRHGTGARAALPRGRPAAGKTGTTQAARDAWFIGYTADYVIGVWMGKDDNAPLTGVTGGGLPADIWRETAERVHRGLPIRPAAPGRRSQTEPQPPRAASSPAGIARSKPSLREQPSASVVRAGRMVASSARSTSSYF